MRQKSYFDYLLLLMLGVWILTIFYIQSPPRLSDHDEILYAVMGRNIANGQGVISNLHHALAVVKDGYPLADVHMPGHMFLLAASFLLLGHNEYAAFFPSHVAYLLTGLLLYWAGRQLGNRRIGFYSTILFFLFPAFIAYANTAFSELTLTFLAALYFVIWLKTLIQPKWPWVFLLALVFIAGMIHHETFILFLPAALYALWQWPRPERWKAVMAFCISGAILFVVAFLPLYLSRATYPHVLAKISDLEGAQGIGRLLVENVSVSLEAIIRPEDLSWQLVMWMQYLLVPVLIVAFPRFNHWQKRAAIYVVFAFIGNFVGLAPFYPLRHWHSVRVFMHLVPPALILIAILVDKIKPAPLKYGAGVALLCSILFAAIFFNTSLIARHQREFLAWQHFDQIAIRNLGELEPKIIMLDGAFRYAWDYYPAAVIYESESIQDLTTLQNLFQRVSIEAILVQEKKQVRERDLLSTLALQNYLLSQNYTFVGADEGYFIFVKQLP